MSIPQQYGGENKLSYDEMMTSALYSTNTRSMIFIVRVDI